MKMTFFTLKLSLLLVYFSGSYAFSQDDPCTGRQTDDCLEHNTSLGKQTAIFSCDNNVQKSEQSAFTLFTVAEHWDESGTSRKISPLNNGILLTEVSKDGSVSSYGEFQTLQVSQQSPSPKLTEWTYTIRYMQKFKDESSQEQGKISIKPVANAKKEKTLVLTIHEKKTDKGSQWIPDSITHNENKHSCHGGLIEKDKLEALGKGQS